MPSRGTADSQPAPALQQRAISCVGLHSVGSCTSEPQLLPAQPHRKVRSLIWRIHQPLQQPERCHMQGMAPPPFFWQLTIHTLQRACEPTEMYVTWRWYPCSQLWHPIGHTCGPPRARSTTMLSTTTSLNAVDRDPNTTAVTAPVGLCTIVAMAAQDKAPAQTGS